jgi:hypothetical protein
MVSSGEVWEAVQEPLDRGIHLILIAYDGSQDAKDLSRRSKLTPRSATGRINAIPRLKGVARRTSMSFRGAT